MIFLISINDKHNLVMSFEVIDIFTLYFNLKILLYYYKSCQMYIFTHSVKETFI